MNSYFKIHENVFSEDSFYIVEIYELVIYVPVSCCNILK